MRRIITVLVIVALLAVFLIPAVAAGNPDRPGKGCGCHRGNMGAAAEDGLHNAYDKSGGANMKSAVYARFHGD
jgi:hypothetical protein